MNAKTRKITTNTQNEYFTAVHNIIQNCMRVTPKDRVIIITDEEREDIGSAIFSESVKLAESKILKIEDFVKRPAKEFPIRFRKAILEFAPSVSIYAATGQTGELESFRFKLIDLLTKDIKCRHGHMINIDSKIMLDGMSQDYAQIYKATHKLHRILSGARVINVTDPHGTNLEVLLSQDPTRKWKASDGVPTKPGDWTNLPDGEIFTCPEKVNGQVVAWELGDYFSQKYGVLEKPITLTIKDSFVINVHSENKTIQKELEEYLSRQENGNRMGEFAIGCLLGLRGLIGNLLQDEKFPGVHMAFGHPYAEHTGQKDWDCQTHVDVIPLNVTALVNGKPLLKDGVFVSKLV